MISSPASYSQGCRFKTLPIGHLSLLMFCGFPQIIQPNALKCIIYKEATRCNFGQYCYDAWKLKYKML